MVFVQAKVYYDIVHVLLDKTVIMVLCTCNLCEIQQKYNKINTTI